MKRVLPLLTVALIAVAAFAWADHHVDGTWEAKIETPRGTSEVTFELKQEGEKLTGTVTGRMGKTDIQDGKVDGDTITFTQAMEGRGRSFTFHYNGKVSGDTIQFTREVKDMGRKQEFTAKRK